MKRKNKIFKGLELEKKLEDLVEKGGDENWNIYYLDEKNQEKWVKEYPNSEYHGGGIPQLRKIEKFPWDIKPVA